MGMGLSVLASGQWSLFAKMVAVNFFSTWFRLSHDISHLVSYILMTFPWKISWKRGNLYYIHLYPNDSPLFSGDDGRNGECHLLISIMEYPHQLLSISITILMRLLSHILLLMIHFYYYPFLLLQKIMRKPTKYPFISLLFPYSHPCISHYSHIFNHLYPIIPINKSLISRDSPVFSSIFRRLWKSWCSMFLW